LTGPCKRRPEVRMKRVPKRFTEIDGIEGNRRKEMT
jgi:hypothetical protein